MMFNFWENISRYPRFFFSAMAGLFLILLSPFRKLGRSTFGKSLFILLFFILIILLGIIFNAMLNI